MSDKKHFRVYLPRIIGGLVVVVAVYFFVEMVGNFLGDKQEKPQRKIQPITLMKPPPPPPPPPKVEKPPEPEIKEKIEEPEPEPEPLPDTPDEAPARDLGLDADASAGSDGFGLAARKGGKGLFGGGNPFAWYGGLIKNEMLGLLNDHDELRRKGFTAIIKVWLKSDGSVDRVELSRGSNDENIDNIISRTLSKFKRVAEPPPPGMEQPIKLKITSRV